MVLQGPREWSVLSSPTSRRWPPRRDEVDEGVRQEGCQDEGATQTHSGPSTVSSMPISELSAAGISRAPAVKSRKPAPNCPTPKNARRARSRGAVPSGSAIGSATSAVSAVASAAAGAIWISGCRRMRTVAIAKLDAMTIASRSPTIAPRR